MASETSHRPAWQKALLNIPKEQRSWVQRISAQNIELFDESVFLLCGYGSRNALDIKNVHILHALFSYYHVSRYKDDFAAHYKHQKAYKRVEPYLNAVVDKIVAQEYDENNPDPEVLVPMWVAAIIFLDQYPFFEKDNAAKIMKLVSPHRSLIDLGVQLVKSCIPSIKSKCDAYLKRFSVPYTSEMVLHNLKSVLLNLELYIHFNVVKKDATAIESLEMFEQMHSSAKSDLETLSSSTTALSPVVPIYKCFSNLKLLDFRFQYSSEYRIDVVQKSTSPLARSDPLEVEWWKTTESYLELLRREICHVKEEEPGNFYTLAALNRQLLNALSHGVAEYVSYTELESVCNELKASIAACAFYTPSLLVAETETECKIVLDEALPFLRTVNPSSYETDSFHYSTPGFLDTFKGDPAYFRLHREPSNLCAACGMLSMDLLKCKACESVWYCDRECQKKGWKAHKVECKELQRAKDA